MCEDDGYCHAPGTALCPPQDAAAPERDGPVDAVSTDGLVDAQADGPPHDAPVDAPPTPRRWRQLSAGHRHTCGLDPDGALYCWGDNEHGKLGIGSTERRATPQPLEGSWTTVAAGEGHTCGIRKGGTLYCWGNNASEQLGREGMPEAQVPVQVRAPDTGWTAVSAGGAHTCGINGGALYCFGGNGAAQLGLGSTDPYTAGTPQRVGEGADWTQVSLGNQHTCALRGTELYCWGDKGSGKLGAGAVPTDYVFSPVRIGGETSQWQAVAAGYTNTCAIATDKTLWCWGLNNLGQLGCAPEVSCDNEVLVPTRVDARIGWDQVSVGGEHACALLGSTLECWGQNAKGQLGRRYFGGRVTARGVDAVDMRTWQSVSVGLEHTCATTQDGRAWSFGSGSDGQRGDGELVDQLRPVRMVAQGAWRSVTAGWTQHSCGVSDQGALLCWGANNVQQLGNGGSADSLVPTVVDTTLRWTRVDGGEDFACALSEDSAVYCWGTNFNGELGSSADGTRPAKVSFTGANDWTALSVGTHHSCGIRQAGSDRTLWCWGDNREGQVSGIGNSQATPIQVDPLGAANWQSASAGDASTCGIRAGQLWCWGKGAAAPVRIGSDTDWIDVSPGYERICGIRFNGTQRSLWCGSPGNATVPVTGLVDMGGQDWQSVACGAAQACALTTAGDLWCWGGNTWGQIGDGTRTHRPDPVAVAGSEKFTEISLGNAFGCARHRADNSVWCWGLGHRGQLGLGTASRPSPVLVLD
jgi:alpha-tubulin suppressor-like RCC1 family protein